MIAAEQAPASDYEERLLAGMAAAVCERGFRDTTIADVVRHARTSRRAFYAHFADREDCFLRLVDRVVDDQISEIAAAVRPGMPWYDQVDAAFAAYLRCVGREPELARSLFRELPSMGERGAALQRALIERFAGMLIALTEAHRLPGSERPPVSIDQAIIVVAGVRELLATAIEHGRDLAELQEPVAGLIKDILIGDTVRAQARRARRTLRAVEP